MSTLLSVVVCLWSSCFAVHLRLSLSPCLPLSLTFQVLSVTVCGSVSQPFPKLSMSGCVCLSRFVFVHLVFLACFQGARNQLAPLARAERLAIARQPRVDDGVFIPSDEDDDMLIG